MTARIVPEQNIARWLEDDVGSTEWKAIRDGAPDGTEALELDTGKQFFLLDKEWQEFASPDVRAVELLEAALDELRKSNHILRQVRNASGYLVFNQMGEELPDE